MKKRSLLFFVLVTVSCCVSANTPFSERKDVQQFTNQTSKKYKLNKTDLSNELNKVKVLESILHAMKKPYESRPWDDYHKLFVTQKRIQNGVTFWNQNKSTLEKAEKKYGVSAQMIVAILGVETNYGETQGHYRVLDALATLAFEYPKRAKFFKKELAQFFLLCHEQHISPSSVLGSYAGAIGQPQFMPSSYRYYAVDFSGNGKKDLRKDTKDAIGSIANYFKKHGWAKNAPIASKASITGYDYKRLKQNPRKARYSINTLKRFGVRTAKPSSPKRASLVALHNTKNSEFWVAYPNFFVITRYNTSNHYAMAVHLLAKNIKKMRLKTLKNKTAQA